MDTQTDDKARAVVPASRLQHAGLFWGLIAGTLVADQLTKIWAVAALGGAQRRVIDLPGPFHLALTRNPGGPFGLALPSWVFPVVTLLVVVLIVARRHELRTKIEVASHALLLGGATGNVIDRIVRAGDPGDPVGYGHVVDFLGSTFFPTFNIADVAINVGFALLVLAVIQEERATRARARDTASASTEPPQEPVQ